VELSPYCILLAWPVRPTSWSSRHLSPLGAVVEPLASRRTGADAQAEHRVADLCSHVAQLSEVHALLSADQRVPLVIVLHGGSDDAATVTFLVSRKAGAVTGAAAPITGRH
jgi:hypothetical protein